MEKILIIARSPAPIDNELKMGSKTIVILRERAVLRPSLSTPSTSFKSSS